MGHEEEQRLDQACFPIRTVCAETGINAITLRAWERRYGLVTPVRTEGGHRLYSRDDIDLVRRVMVLQDKGIPVSRAIAWIKQHPHEPLPEPNASLPVAAETNAESASPSGWARLRERMLDAVARFDEFDIEAAWQDAVEQYPGDVVTQYLLLPVGKLLHDQATGDGGRAALNFYWAFLRNRIGARYANQARDAQGARVLLAAAPGSHAEITLLLTGIALAQQGLRPVLFAAGTPLPALAVALQRCRARALVLLADALPPASFGDEIAAIARDGVVVFAGGEALAGQQEKLRARGAIYQEADPVGMARLVRDVLGTPPA